MTLGGQKTVTDWLCHCYKGRTTPAWAGHLHSGGHLFVTFGKKEGGWLVGWTGGWIRMEQEGQAMTWPS